MHAQTHACKTFRYVCVIQGNEHTYDIHSHTHVMCRHVYEVRDNVNVKKTAHMYIHTCTFTHSQYTHANTI
jgi:hypothetical protein